MSRLLGHLLPASACGGAFLLAASPVLGQPPAPGTFPPPPAERIVMQLEYNGVASCSDPEPFVLALTPRVNGWDPISTTGRWRLVVTIKRRAAGYYEGSAELHDPKGDVMWTRAFPPKPTCSILVERLAFAVALRIDMGDQPSPPLPAPAPVCSSVAPVSASAPPAAKDPSCEDMTEVAPPLPEPPSTPTPREPKTALSFRLGAGGWIGQVTEDRAAIGLTLDAGVRYGWFSAAIEGRGDPPLGAVPTFTGGSVNYARATGALLLCMHYGWLVGCAKGEAGRLLILGNTTPNTYGYGAVGLRLGLDFPVAPPRFFLRIAGDVLATVDPASVTFKNRSAFQVAGTNAGLGLGALLVLDKP